MKLLDALKSNKRIRHENWYDGRAIDWKLDKQYLLITRELIESDKWEVVEEKKDFKRK